MSRDGRLVAIAGGAGLVYLVLAILMGVLPGMALSKTAPGPGVTPLTPEQEAGRAVYVAEGCSYCHTQQVRPLAMDKVFGRPSAAGDYAYATPELLGSERTGPDLSNVGVRQPAEVWQYIHLYDPRAVVPPSIMPSYRWLFRVVPSAPPGETAVALPPAYAPKSGVVVPTARAKALVAYLLSLKQPALSPEMQKAAQEAEQAMAPAKPAAGQAAAPASAGAAKGFDYAATGPNLYAANCAACHGAQGTGVAGAFPPLVNDPVVTASDPAEHLKVVLDGLHGKAIGGTAYGGQMPAFASQLSDEQIAAIVDHERTAWGNHAPTVTPADVARVRKGGR
ncbi:c-type cytochrome [bacterium]|nr:MAG: c-type cytochrome [bacterium]